MPWYLYIILAWVSFCLGANTDSMLGFCNMVLLQFTGFRLARRCIRDVSTGTLQQIGWTIAGPYAPMTGWWGPYWPRQKMRDSRP